MEYSWNSLSKSGRRGVALASLVFLASFQMGADAAPVPTPSEVDDLVLAPHPHGISFSAAQELPAAPVPRLLSILDDPRYSPYWVNAVVTLGFLQDPAVVDHLIGFYRKTAAPVDLFALRAHLAVPFALGSIASNSEDQQALQFLRKDLNQLLEDAEDVRLGVDLTPARLEQTIIGLAVANSPPALDALAALRRRLSAPGAAGQTSERISGVLDEAANISARITSEGRASYFSYNPVSQGQGSLNFSGKGLPVPTQIGAVRHSLTGYSESDLDLDLAAATNVLGSVAFRVDRSLPEGVAVGRLGGWKSSSRKHWV